MEVSSALQSILSQGQGDQKSTVTSGDGLGKNSFLQLLVTQMRYQDPLQPASNTEYMSQLAQFSALEQMQNLNDKFDQMLKWSQMTQASSLIGKQIDGLVSLGVDNNHDGKPDTTSVSGAVSEVKYVNGEPNLVVNGQQVGLANITRIYA